MTALVRYETREQVATVTLDSPHNRNALTMAAWGPRSSR
jgi:enoyl-CoA hydratase/carnithine racemase